MKSIVMGPFLLQKTVNNTFFTNSCTWNVFLTRESLFPLYALSFWLRLIVAKPWLVHL